jgi:hypothetical protein
MKPGHSRARIAALFLILLITSCSSSQVSTGGGGGTATGNGPVLYSVSINPPTAPHSSSVTFHFTFNFSDPAGNLNGGTLTYIRDGSIHTVSLPNSLAGQTGGNSPTIFTTDILSPKIGAVTFQFFITDNDGNQSNTITVAYVQT